MFICELNSNKRRMAEEVFNDRDKAVTNGIVEFCGSQLFKNILNRRDNHDIS